MTDGNDHNNNVPELAEKCRFLRSPLFFSVLRGLVRFNIAFEHRGKAVTPAAPCGDDVIVCLQWGDTFQQCDVRPNTHAHTRTRVHVWTCAHEAGGGGMQVRTAFIDTANMLG